MYVPTSVGTGKRNVPTTRNDDGKYENTQAPNYNSHTGLKCSGCAARSATMRTKRKNCGNSMMSVFTRNLGVRYPCNNVGLIRLAEMEWTLAML